MNKKLKDIKELLEIVKKIKTINLTNLQEINANIDNLICEIQDLDDERKLLIKTKNLISEKESNLRVLKNIFKGIIASSIILGLIVFYAFFFKNGVPIVVSSIMAGVMAMSGPLVISLLNSNYDEIKTFLQENKVENIESKLVENAEKRLSIEKQIQNYNLQKQTIVTENTRLQETKFKTEKYALNNSEEKQESIDLSEKQSHFQKKIGTKINSTNSNK